MRAHTLRKMLYLGTMVFYQKTRFWLSFAGEAAALKNWCTALRIIRYNFLNYLRNKPSLVFVSWLQCIRKLRWMNPKITLPRILYRYLLWVPAYSRSELHFIFYTMNHNVKYTPDGHNFYWHQFLSLSYWGIWCNYTFPHTAHYAWRQEGQSYTIPGNVTNAEAWLWVDPRTLMVCEYVQQYTYIGH